MPYSAVIQPLPLFFIQLGTEVSMLAVPVPEQPPELVKGVLTYRYADPELEALSPAAKHLLRLGPENAREIQEKLRFFRNALDLPE